MDREAERRAVAESKINVAGLTTTQWERLTNLAVIVLRRAAPAGLSARTICDTLRENGGRWFTVHQVETALVIHRVPCADGRFYDRDFEAKGRIPAPAPGMS